MSAKAATALWVTLFLGLWILNSFLRVPVEYVQLGSVIAAVIFIALPVAGIFSASSLDWKPWISLVGVGVFLIIVAAFAKVDNPIAAGVVQIARIGWPLCLGILITGLIKDKNLLLPIAIVLATVDILAVMSPVGTVKQGLQHAAIRPIFDALAYQVPKFGSPTPAAQMGPADPLFLGMFFYALRRFGMRTQKTLLWMIPALVLYLFVVLAFGNTTVYGISLGALPALVPIGIVVIAVNRGEFTLTKQESAMVWIIGLACVLLLAIAFFAWQPKPQGQPVEMKGVRSALDPSSFRYG